MTRTVFRGGRVFDGSATLVAADVAVEDGRIVDVGPGLDGDEAVDLVGPGGPARPVRLPHPRHGHPRPARHQQGAGDALLLLVLCRHREPSPDPRSRHHHRPRRGRARTSASSRRSPTACIAGPRLHIATTHPLADRWPRRRLVAVRLRHHAGRPGRACPRASSTGRTRCGARAREIIRAGADQIKVCTSGGVLSPRDDPRHGHFRDDELAVLVEEANAAGHPGHGPRAGRAGHQGRRAGRHPEHRPRHLPRRRGHRADARARHVAGADARGAPGRPRRRRRRRRHPGGQRAQGDRGHRHPPVPPSAERSRPASRWPWAPTPA